ncbi:MAG: phospholipase [Bacteroidota bacterium]
MKKILIFSLVFLWLFPVAFGQSGSFSEYQYTCKDGVARPYIIYSSKKTAEQEKAPLLIYLHGAISNKSLKKDPLAYIKKSKLLSLADKGAYHLLFCYGQKGATWFDTVGMDMVIGEMEEVIQKLNIDEQKVFLSGFSDGASGVLYFAMVHPAPFAGFIAMNGHLKVANNLGHTDLFPANMNGKALYIINTQSDVLYPLHQVRPTITYLKQYNPNITFKTPEGNHEMSYLEAETASLIAFIKKNQRMPLKKISWESSDPSSSAIDWLSIVQIDSLSKESKDWHQPYQLQVFNDKADFGLKYDYSYPGPGLKVSGFKNDTCTAKRMGIQKDDLLMMMEQDSMSSPYSPYYYVAKKRAGDSTSLTVQRADQTLEFKGVFNPGHYYEVFEQQQASAKLFAYRKGKKLVVTTSKVAAFRIDFDEMGGKEVREMEVNGEGYESSFRGVEVIKTE